MMGRCEKCGKVREDVNVFTLAGGYACLVCLPCHNDFVEFCRDRVEFHALEDIDAHKDYLLSLQSEDTTRLQRLINLNKQYRKAQEAMFRVAKAWVKGEKGE